MYKTPILATNLTKNCPPTLVKSIMRLCRELPAVGVPILVTEGKDRLIHVYCRDEMLENTPLSNLFTRKVPKKIGSIVVFSINDLPARIKELPKEFNSMIDPKAIVQSMDNELWKFAVNVQSASIRLSGKHLNGDFSKEKLFDDIATINDKDWGK